MADNGKFANEYMKEGNPKWEDAVKRKSELYPQNGGFRTEFERDYTRILHSLGYRRLKHKTQVFFNTRNDHVCTRIEHVNHVDSVSYTIAKKLGLNTELTKAIATGHDIGHAPFGHQGEREIKWLACEHLNELFFHERNSLHYVDDIEIIEDSERDLRNLALTYAVRDGIISHCGEIDENSIKPREQAMDLSYFVRPGEYQPYTWEGCVVKISDKISYLGRDIEDAIRLKFIGDDDLKALDLLVKEQHKLASASNSLLITTFIKDLTENSTVEEGLRFSDDCADLLNGIKKYNYEHIYSNKRFESYKKYVTLVIKSIFEELAGWYDKDKTIDNILNKSYCYPQLSREFAKWICQYCDDDIIPDVFNVENCCNNKMYGKLCKKRDYLSAVIDFITGMTDQYAITVFNELISF